MSKGRVRLAIALAVAALSASDAAMARSRPREVYDMVLGQPVPPPMGYYYFCEREPEDCFEPADARRLAMAGGAPSRRRPAESDAADVAPPMEKPNYWAFAFRSAAAGQRLAYRGREPLAGPPASIRGRDREDEGGFFRRGRVSPRKLLGGFAAFPPTLDDDRRIVMTRDVKSTLNRINRGVNRRVISVSDQTAYGELDYWGLPISRNARRWGDCEDYVMEKRHQLLADGYPMAQLSIALVRTRWGDTHAVLLVETNEGTLALDSFSNWITPWWKLDYTWIMRQSPEDPSRWVTVLGEGWFGREVSLDG
jgi:predicted transglutaminase-like cysteine proteinase